MSVAEDMMARMRGMADDVQARHLMRFFKTGPGEYGEGDLFLGIRVPATRALVKEYRKNVSIADVNAMIASPYHEIRLAALLSLTEIYIRSKRARDVKLRCHVVDCYLGLIDRGNNWDLVDLVAPKILGDWLLDNPSDRHILDSLAGMGGFLWHQRVGIVATWTLISHGEYDDTIRIATRLLNHTHGLIHKATGWMLREVGKRGGEQTLVEFLDRHATSMPRTMLRYAIERMPEPQRLYYLHK